MNTDDPSGSDDGATTATDEAMASDDESPPPRRALLGAIGALTALSALSGTTTAQGDGAIQTRGCSDSELTPRDWSTGAVTVQACPTGDGSVTVSVTGRVSENRYVASTAGLPSSRSLFVSAGNSRTLWFTGQLLEFSCSNDDLNVGIVTRG